MLEIEEHRKKYTLSLFVPLTGHHKGSSKILTSQKKCLTQQRKSDCCMMSISLLTIKCRKFSGQVSQIPI